MDRDHAARRERIPTRSAIVAVGIALGIALSGCTVGEIVQPTPEPPTQPTAIPTATSLPEGAEPAEDIPTDVANDVGLRANVVLTDCLPTDGGWEATGTAVNQGAVTRMYEITVFFATPAATVLDHATTTVSVEPGDVATWSASKQFASGGEAQCVIRGVS